MNSKNLILLDVFSYSCINCLRSLGFIKKIDKKYRKFGLDTILIHPPEWEFEKLSGNIDSAIKQYKINFPIIIDKDKKMTKKLKINFWPTQILIRDGKMLYKHIKEGNYKKLESKIIQTLKIKTKRLFDEEPKYSKFPTLYLGKRKQKKAIYFDNQWVQKKEYLQSIKNNSSFTLLTKGNIINFVAESLSKKPIKMSVKINNKHVKNLTINKPQLYNIIKLENNKKRKLTLITKSGLVIYSFSFQ